MPPKHQKPSPPQKIQAAPGTASGISLGAAPGTAPGAAPGITPGVAPGVIPWERLKQAHALLQKRGETLAAAESCTGGLLSFWLTAPPGASKRFKGGAVAYAGEAKAALLGLDPEWMKKNGLVNQDCAALMARGVRNLLKSDWGVSVTGAAGPSPGSKGEPVGLAAFGLSSKNVENTRLKQFKSGSREEIRRRAALFALDLLISGLK